MNLITGFCGPPRARPPVLVGGREGSNSPVGERDSRDLRSRARRWVISNVKKVAKTMKKNQASQFPRDHISESLAQRRD